MKTFLSFCLLGFASLSLGQMVSGRDMPGFNRELGLDPALKNVEVGQIGTSLVTNVLNPGEQGSFTFRFQNRSTSPRELRGTLRTVGYRTSVPPGDIWVPNVFATGVNGQAVPVSVKLAPNGATSVTLRPTVPSRFGGYALVFDFGADGRAFGGTVARVVAPEPGRVMEPTYAIDMPWPHEMSEAVTRTFLKLGVKGCRMGASFTPTTHPDFERDMAALGQHLEWAQRNNVTVMLTIGAGKAPMPLGRGRPWLRPDNSLIEGNKEDLAWLPEYDEDFRKWVRILCERYGWPKGPVNAVELWNEPWEGVSISGWGADLPRYREIYRQMALGVKDARRDAGVRVLIGGTSSSSNTRDKLFPDGSLEFLDMLDFVSIHYEGTGASPGLDPLWMNRKHEYGRVRVWDTESWVANSEDRIAGVVASMRSFGQDRAMGTYGGNVYSPTVVKVDGKDVGVVQAWSPAAAVAAAAKFIGQRPFRRLLFPNGLPWVYVFGGERNPDDGTLVVLGDMTRLYSPNAILYRQAQLALPKAGGRLSVVARPEFTMLDFAGNVIAPKSGRYEIPLNGNGYFLRANGTRGSFDRLQRAVSQGRIEGYPPAVIQVKDFIDPNLSQLRVVLTNVLNRPVRGALTAKFGAVQTQPVQIRLEPNQTREVTLTVRGLRPRPDNLYPGEFTFNGQSHGIATHREILRLNLIQARTVVVDGNLDDWNGAIPQALTGEGMRASLTEEAWLPFQRRLQSGGSLTTAWVAHDDRGFYYAARITDPTPYAGNVRFETRDDDRYYYPREVFTVGAAGTMFSVRWTGTVVPPRSGEYRIHAVSDDGVRLWVNGELLVDSWVGRGETTDTRSLRLESGKPVQLRMEYFQGGGGAVARLQWEGPGLERQPIATEWKREVFSGTELQSPMGVLTDEKIDFTLGPNFPGTEAAGARQVLVWPDGVRRFTYRMDPDLPAGNGTDNVQIAFNVYPNDRKRLAMHPAGVMPKYMIYPCTDYEFAFNSVAPEFGGGTEIFRLLAPGMPRKHFYPRQPRAPIDGGPVKSGSLVMSREGNVRIVEAFIPWSEIPGVKEARDAGRTVKFSFRVNDNDGPAYELALGRSVSKENPSAFHNDWQTHWANELEFAFGGRPGTLGGNPPRPRSDGR